LLVTVDARRTEQESVPRMQRPPKIVVVDTNCYVRLLHSPLRPLLGTVVSGHKLMTTVDLAAETLGNSGLGGRQAWLASADIQADMGGATLKFREPKSSRVADEANAFRRTGNAILRKDCEAKGIFVRTLSIVDARAWAAAAILNGVLATDEWPLRLVSTRVDVDDDGNKLGLFSTIDLVHLLEQAGALTSAQRVDLMRSWRLSGEALHREADDDYRRLFQDDPPDAQADIAHKA